MSQSSDSPQQKTTKLKEWIPIEMHVDIMKQLPEKSLIRFKSVSKSWESTISHNAQKLILWSSKFIVVMEYEVHTAKVKELSLPMQCKYTLNLVVRASCNGILWVSLNDFEEFLWNPFTGEYKQLPFKRNQGLLGGSESYGLGYDYFTDDYKIVWFADIRKPPRLYSVKNDCWKVLDNNHLFSSVHLENPHDLYSGGTLVNNGVLYWKAIYYNSHFQTKEDSCVVCPSEGCAKQELAYKVLIGFDFAKESAVLLVYPQGLTKYNSQLMDFKGSLCAFQLKRSGIHIDMWVLKDDEGKLNWMKLMYINCSEIFPSRVQGSILLEPIYFTRDGDVLLSLRERRSLASRKQTTFYGYNPKEDRFRRVSLLPRICYWLHEIRYNESLSSLNHKGTEEGQKEVEKHN